MKIKYGLILASFLSTSLLAQTPAPAPQPALPLPPPPMATPPPPVNMAPPNDISAPATNKPPAKAKKPVRKKTVKKTEPKKSSPNMLPLLTPESTLVPNEPAEAMHNNINIRGQAHINSEVVGHLQKGEIVTVLEVVTLKHPKTDEPAVWARIALPASLGVWVDNAFVDSSNQVVKAHKLNMRGGPGENYSIVGTLSRGEVIKGIKTKGNWTEIEAPTNSFAYVAAHMLAHKQAAPAPLPEPVPLTPMPTLVTGPGPIAPPPTSEGAGANGLSTQPNMPLPAPAPLPQVEEPLPKRVVEREGVVGGTVSIQSPSHYELHSLDNGKVMDYLYTTSTNLALSRYKGLTVLVSGEEELDERWPNTPVITIQKIQVVK